MALDIESVLDGGVNGQEALGWSGRFETPHLALSPSCRLMRTLSPIVCAQAPVVASRQSDFGLCRAVRAQLVRHSLIRRKALFLKAIAEDLKRDVRFLDPRSLKESPGAPGRGGDLTI
jgi:hypothetical protein